MSLSLILAASQNGVIGANNRLPWRLPADLAYFKRLTLGHSVVMGRKTHESIGKPLPGRTNIIVTRDRSFACSNCIVLHSLEEALLFAHKKAENEVFIIGGGMIYEQSRDLWNKLYLTEIDTTLEGDIFFPEINWSQWELVSEEKKQADEKNAYNLKFKVFTKKS